MKKILFLLILLPFISLSQYDEGVQPMPDLGMSKVQIIDSVHFNFMEGNTDLDTTCAIWIKGRMVKLTIEECKDLYGGAGGSGGKTYYAGYGINLEGGDGDTIEVDVNNIATKAEIRVASDSLYAKIPETFTVSLSESTANNNFILVKNDTNVLKQIIRPFSQSINAFDVGAVYWNGSVISSGTDNAAPFRVDNATQGSNHHSGNDNLRRELTMYVDGVRVKDYEKVYHPNNTFTVKETYDLKGNSTPGAIAKVTYTYTWDRYGTYTIYGDYLALQDVPMKDIMFLMHTAMSGGYYLYVPKSLPFSIYGEDYDMSVPYKMSQFNPDSVFYIDTTNTVGTGLFADRAVCIKSDVTFSLGYLPVQDATIERRRELAKEKALEVQYNTNKLYFSAVDPNDGDTLRAGTYYSVVAYKNYSQPLGYTTASYFVDYNDVTYGYFDWHFHNLFDETEVVAGKYVNSSNGNIQDASGDTDWKISGYIPVTPHETYTLSGDRGRLGLAFFNSNSTDIALAYDTTATLPATVTAPAGANYVVFNLSKPGDTVYNNVQFEKGDTPTAYRRNENGKLTDRIYMPERVSGKEFSVFEKSADVAIKSENTGSILFEIEASGYAVLKFDTDSSFSKKPSDLNQEGATDGQVIKWNDSAGEWQPADDPIAVPDTITLTTSRSLTSIDANSYLRNKGYDTIWIDLQAGVINSNEWLKFITYNIDSTGRIGLYSSNATLKLIRGQQLDSVLLPAYIDVYYQSGGTYWIMADTANNRIEHLQDSIDALILRIEKLEFPAITISADTALKSGNAWEMLRSFSGTHQITLNDSTNFQTGDKVLIQVGNGSTFNVVAAGSVQLNFAAAGTGTFDLTSTAGGVATRVLECIGVNEYIISDE